MRALAAILAYVLAAASGLAAGYYATAPRTSAPPALSAAASERHPGHTGGGGPADLEAVATFLAAESSSYASSPSSR